MTDLQVLLLQQRKLTPSHIGGFAHTTVLYIISSLIILHISMMIFTLCHQFLSNKLTHLHNVGIRLYCLFSEYEDPM